MSAVLHRGVCEGFCSSCFLSLARMVDEYRKDESQVSVSNIYNQTSGIIGSDPSFTDDGVGKAL